MNMIIKRISRVRACGWLGAWLALPWVFSPSPVCADEAPALSPEQSSAIQLCLEEARQKGYPVELVQQRRDEGLSKRVDPALVVQAVQLRMKFLQAAELMMREAGCAMEEPSARGLQGSIALAKESGVSTDSLMAILKKSGGRDASRIQGAIEVGESLHLAGMNDETVRGLMEDCIDRNLRRSEMLRTTRYAVQQHRGGLSGQEIRLRLWGETGTSDGEPHGGKAGLGRASGTGGQGRQTDRGQGGYGSGAGKTK